MHTHINDISQAIIGAASRFIERSGQVYSNPLTNNVCHTSFRCGKFPLNGKRHCTSITKAFDSTAVIGWTFL